jgi:phasin family protein
MFQTPDQFVKIQKDAFEMFQKAAMTTIAGAEKIAALNLQAAKASVEESYTKATTLFEAKDVQGFAQNAAGAVQPAADKLTAYAKHVYDISSVTGTELAKLWEKQLAESNKTLHAAIDPIAKNAPAGSEGLISLVKSSVGSMTSAFDQVSKAGKQAVELAEANLAAATKSTVRAKKAA